MKKEYIQPIIEVLELETINPFQCTTSYDRGGDGHDKHGRDDWGDRPPRDPRLFNYTWDNTTEDI